MFHGQPVCRACGYEGPDHMWMTHGGGYGVLVQNRDTLGLRVAFVTSPGADVRESLRPLPEVEGEAAWARHLARVADPPLGSSERVVLHSEVYDLAFRGDADAPTRLPCPQCGLCLTWRYTGIS